MSEAPASPCGFTARLLDRADGRINALRPGIPPVFSAEQERSAPLLERTEQSRTAPPIAAPQAEPAAAKPSHTAANGDSAEPSLRLMPPADLARPFLPVVEAPAQVPQPVEYSAAFPPAARQGQRHGRSVAAATGSARHEDRPPSEPLRPRRGDSLSAAVMQLLGDAGPGESGPEPSSTNALPPELQRGPDSASPSQRERAETAVREALAPGAEPGLTIHIGEIVVAPEPVPAPGAAPSPPPWQPPLSLSDYRARRAQERR